MTRVSQKRRLFMEEMVINTCKVANYVAVKKLKFHPSNAELRSISPERFNELKNSLVNKGFYEPILVWKKNGYVLAGNQRLKAAQELIAEGYTFMTPDGKKNELPVVVEDVDEKMAMQILHQANNHHGDWVTQKLAEAIREAGEMGVAFADMGYSQEDHDRIIKEALASIEDKDYSDKNKEVSTEDFGSDLEHQCPKCGFEFND